MTPAAASRLYRRRRVGLALALALPIVLLGGAYLLVTRLVLVPRVPDAGTPGDQVARFIMHPQGLPRLDQAERERVLTEQTGRLAADPALLDRFLAEVRTASPDDQAAFRNHLFDAFKPVLLRDIEAWQALSEARRRDFVDGRIVVYNRMGSFTGNLHISRRDLGSAAPSPQELLQWFLAKTTAAERQAGTAYLNALATRVNEILADPALQAEFEQRIGQAH